MGDTTPRNPVSAPQMIADALLRSAAGTSAQLRVTGASSGGNQTEVGLIATDFTEIAVSPVVMRKLRPTTKPGDTARWEMLASATSVQQQVNALDLPSAQSLFALTLAITVAGSEYLIESITSNEAFGRVYLYRLTLREAFQQSLL